AVDGDWAHVATSVGTTCAIRMDGGLWCWGDDSCGQLGNGMGANCDATLDVTAPVPVDAGTTWAAVAAGPGFACGLHTDGTLWCWGDDTEGRLGIGAPPQSTTAPAQVGNAMDWTAIAAGGLHACGLRAGELWCWGGNGSGQLGDGGAAIP